MCLLSALHQERTRLCCFPLGARRQAWPGGICGGSMSVSRPFPPQRVKHLPQSQLPGSPVQLCGLWANTASVSTCDRLRRKAAMPSFLSQGLRPKVSHPKSRTFQGQSWDPIFSDNRKGSGPSPTSTWVGGEGEEKRTSWKPRALPWQPQPRPGSSFCEVLRRRQSCNPQAPAVDQQGLARDSQPLGDTIFAPRLKGLPSGWSLNAGSRRDSVLSSLDPR